MKTTLQINDVVFHRLKGEALRRHTTMSALVEAALQALFRHRPSSVTLPPLPGFKSGGARVNVANRDALYDVLDRA